MSKFDLFKQIKKYNEKELQEVLKYAQMDIDIWEKRIIDTTTSETSYKIESMGAKCWNMSLEEFIPAKRESLLKVKNAILKELEKFSNTIK